MILSCLSLTRLQRTSSLLRHVAQQGACSRPQTALALSCHLHSSAAATSTPSGRTSAKQSASEVSKGQKLLEAWQGQVASKEASENEIRSLLQAAVSLRRIRAPGVTDQLLQLVMSLYSTQTTASGKDRFHRVICKDFGVQVPEVAAAIHSFQSAEGKAEHGEGVLLHSIERLRQATLPMYSSLFLPLSNQPGGIRFLMDMRADILEALKRRPGSDVSSHLRALSDSLKASLSDWFSVGLLELRRISWEASSGALLLKVMQYEQVHPYSHTNPWTDLQSRLSPTRRVFGFFHGSMPKEPLVLLHVALMPNITASMHEILHPSDPAFMPEDSKAAIFYSISSTQTGLSGIELGNFLIKQAAIRLLNEFPQIQALSTLSPIPGFANWLLNVLDRELSEKVVAKRIGLSTAELEAIRPIWQKAKADSSGRGAELLQAFREGIMFKVTTEDDIAEAKGCLLWKTMLMRRVAHYLLVEKRRNNALDPVANFHLRNGAEVWRLNWKAYDNSDSFGIMVNYRYILADITVNNQAYIHNGKIAAAPQVERLLVL